MKKTITTSFSRKLNMGNYQTEDYFTCTSYEMDIDEYEKIGEEGEQLRQEAFDDCKKFVFIQIKKRKEEIEGLKAKKEEKEMLKQFDATTKQATNKRKK